MLVCSVTKYVVPSIEHSSPCPSPTVATSNGMARQGDREEHPQTMPEFISSGKFFQSSVLRLENFPRGVPLYLRS